MSFIFFYDFYNEERAFTFMCCSSIHLLHHVYFGNTLRKQGSNVPKSKMNSLVASHFDPTEHDIDLLNVTS